MKDQGDQWTVAERAMFWIGIFLICALVLAGLVGVRFALSRHTAIYDSVGTNINAKNNKRGDDKATGKCPNFLLGMEDTGRNTEVEDDDHGIQIQEDDGSYELHVEVPKDDGSYELHVEAPIDDLTGDRVVYANCNWHLRVLLGSCLEDQINRICGEHTPVGTREITVTLYDDCDHLFTGECIVAHIEDYCPERFGVQE